MTIWDSLTGRKSSSSPTATAEPHDNFTPAPFDPNSAVQNPSEFLIDPSQLHPLAGLNQDTLDYLALEDSVLSDLPGSRSALPSRGWSDDLCYGTGVSYLSALSVGGAWGLAEGLQKNPPTMPPRLRLNGVLNAVTRRGPFLGNSAGVIAMVYNGINSTIGYWRGKHDISNSVVAGALSGAIFKSTRGVRPMMISSGIVASVAGSWALFRKVYFESDTE
ncbi:mitochondrial import i [Lophiostoma macrostomum CBS 122681]|uniref:Mitochondrial import i n=1 Tax=Lophiostoma macrostomum CBS 122681 TaxID=1314788 RepID=A0A6A6TSV8_9PLEO|nr:mitochondrial import i [Lophiostoma macrostomum CBS 122681]